MFEIVGEKQHFTQYELNQLVVNPCMKVNDKVVFRNSCGKTSVTYAREHDGKVVADVPNILLQYPLNILVNLRQDNELHIDCETVFSVMEAEKPEDYTFVDNIIPKPAQNVVASVQSDWNASEGEPGYIKNRTHYEAYEFEPITWDGNTDGLLCVVHSGTSYYKVAELPSNMPETYCAKNLSKIPVIFNEKEYISMGGLSLFENGDNLNGITGMVFRIGPKENPNDKIPGFAIICKENIRPYEQDTVFPETGIYFVKNDAGEFCSWYSGLFVTHQLDKKYLPTKVYSFSQQGSSVYAVGFDTMEDVTTAVNGFEDPNVSIYYITEYVQNNVQTTIQAKCVSIANMINLNNYMPTVRLLFLNPIDESRIQVDASIAFDANGNFESVLAERVFDNV